MVEESTSLTLMPVLLRSWRSEEGSKSRKVDKKARKSERMKAKSAVAAVVLGGRAAEGLIFNPPHCALPGLQVLLIFLKKD